jgi:hypothetical protein
MYSVDVLCRLLQRLRLHPGSHKRQALPPAPAALVVLAKPLLRLRALVAFRPLHPLAVPPVLFLPAVVPVLFLTAVLFLPAVVPVLFLTAVLFLPAVVPVLFLTAVPPVPHRPLHLPAVARVLHLTAIVPTPRRNEAPGSRFSQ